MDPNGTQYFDHLVGHQRSAEVIALDFVALMLPQKRHLRFVFNALGNHLEVQSFCHADDGDRDRGIVGVHRDILNKRIVPGSALQQLDRVYSIEQTRECWWGILRNAKASNKASRENEMAELIREECYILSIGLEKHFLRVQELISAPTDWPDAFRIQLAASSRRAARNFYGATASAVLDLAVAYLSERLTEAGGQPAGQEIASPIMLENLPNRLTCADIVENTARRTKNKDPQTWTSSALTPD